MSGLPVEKIAGLVVIQSLQDVLVPIPPPVTARFVVSVKAKFLKKPAKVSMTGRDSNPALWLKFAPHELVCTDKAAHKSQLSVLPFADHVKCCRIATLKTKGLRRRNRKRPTPRGNRTHNLLITGVSSTAVLDSLPMRVKNIMAPQPEPRVAVAVVVVAVKLMVTSPHF